MSDLKNSLKDQTPFKSGKIHLSGWFDGACEPVNPNGNMGFGWYVKSAGEIIGKGSDFTPAKQGNSNNVAEYTALKNLLKFLLKEGLHTETTVIIYGDSKMAVNQMNGNWQIKGGYYAETARECKDLVSRFDSINFNWIPRAKNELADKLSKEQLIKNKVTIHH